MKKQKNFILVALGHMVIDSVSGFFPIYLAMRDLNLVKAGLIATLSNLISNFAQPLFGFWADRIQGRRLMIAALFLGPVCMSLIGLTETYWIIAFLVTAGKVMVSLYHPAAVSMATLRDDGGRSTFRLALFTSLGSLGFAFTGLQFNWFCSRFGYDRSFFLALPGLAMAIVIFALKPHAVIKPAEANLRGLKADIAANFGPLASLYALVVLRSVVQISIIYAAPTLYKEWGFPQSMWAVPHFLFVFFGALGMITFSQIEKRIDPLKLIAFSMVVHPLIGLPFLYFGIKGSALSLVLVALLGFINFASFPANVVLGQQRLPRFAGTVSGLLMGAAWGVAGFSAVIISAMGKMNIPGVKYGSLVPGLALSLIVPVAGTWFCSRLKKSG